MINPFKAITTYEEDDSFEDYLKKINILEAFSEIIAAYPDKKIAKGAIRFILYGYSVDSDMLHTTGNDWGKLRDKIFKRTGLPENLYEDIAMLKKDAVLICIQKWLDLQNDANWTQYITYRDLRRQFLEASLFPLPTEKKKSAEPQESEDYSKMKNMIDAKMTAANNSRELLVMMEDALKTFIQNSPKLKESVTTFNKANATRNTVSVEDFIDAV